MTHATLYVVAQLGAAPVVPWVVFIWIVGGIIASAGAFYSTKYAIKHEVDDVRSAVARVDGKMDVAKADLERQIADRQHRRSRMNRQVRKEIAALREDVKRRHEENVARADKNDQRGKFTLKLVTEMARQMGV
ncbi:MAG TPA: hypothetical protein VNN79_11795, partial [Actinomycetota bacterium]|nr:hypothetical protein [Actinomycetota bacterium]